MYIDILLNGFSAAVITIFDGPLCSQMDKDSFTRTTPVFFFFHSLSTVNGIKKKNKINLTNGTSKIEAISRCTQGESPQPTVALGHRAVAFSYQRLATPMAHRAHTGGPLRDHISFSISLYLHFFRGVCVCVFLLNFTYSLRNWCIFCYGWALFGGTRTCPRAWSVLCFHNPLLSISSITVIMPLRHTWWELRFSECVHSDEALYLLQFSLVSILHENILSLLLLQLGFWSSPNAWQDIKFRAKKSASFS